MKKIFLLLFPALLLWACNDSAPEEWPQDLEGKKAFLQAKRTQLKIQKEELAKVNEEIAQLKDEIRAINPDAIEKTRRPVKVKTLASEDFARTVELQATVQPQDAVMASSETGGRIAQLLVKEGQAVKKGQLVAKIDMQVVDKQIAELQTALELAKDVYERQSKLWEQNIGSEIQFLQAKNNKERLEKSLETAQFQLTKANVYAPMSGVVDMVIAEAGEMSGPGTPIVRIMNTYTVKVIASAPEKYLPIVKRGASVNIKFPAIDQERKAKVSTVGRTINPANRSFEVEVLLNNPGAILKPNLLGLMEVEDYAAKGVITIPTDKVQQEVTGKDYVYIKGQGREGTVAQKVYIETGERAEGNVIITSGLKAGDELIIDGARGLTDKELIEVVQ